MSTISTSSRSPSMSREEMLAIWIEEKKKKKESAQKKSNGGGSKVDRGRWSAASDISTSRKSTDSRRRSSRSADSRDAFTTPKQQYDIPQLKTIAITSRRSQSSVNRSGSSTSSQQSQRLNGNKHIGSKSSSRIKRKPEDAKESSNSKYNSKGRTPLSSVSRNSSSLVNERKQRLPSRLLSLATPENEENQTQSAFERVAPLSFNPSTEPRVCDSKVSCESHLSPLSDSYSPGQIEITSNNRKMSNTTKTEKGQPSSPSTLSCPISPASTISSVSQDIFQGDNIVRVIFLNEMIPKTDSKQDGDELASLSKTDDAVPSHHAVHSERTDGSQPHLIVETSARASSVEIVDEKLDSSENIPVFFSLGNDEDSPEESFITRKKRRNRRRDSTLLLLPKPSLEESETINASPTSESEPDQSGNGGSSRVSSSRQNLDEKQKCGNQNRESGIAYCTNKAVDNCLKTGEESPTMPTPGVDSSRSLCNDNGDIDDDSEGFVPEIIVKVGNKTILQDIPETTKGLLAASKIRNLCSECSECSGAIQTLRSQVEQLMVEKEKMQKKLRDNQSSYESRITPFRDVFEENKNLCSENQLLKKEKLSTKASVDKMVAELQQQMISGLTAAVTKTKKLEIALAELKRQNEVLQEKLQT